MVINGKNIECNADLVAVALGNREFMDKCLKAKNLSELKGKDFSDFEMYIFQEHYSHLLEDERNKLVTPIYEYDNNFNFPITVAV